MDFWYWIIVIGATLLIGTFIAGFLRLLLASAELMEHKAALMKISVLMLEAQLDEKDDVL